MKNSTKTPTVKTLQKQIDTLRQEQAERLATVSAIYDKRLYSAQWELGQERRNSAALLTAGQELARQLEQARNTIQITAQSMDIERMELAARADRLGMRIAGLGVQ